MAQRLRSGAEGRTPGRGACSVHRPTPIRAASAAGVGHMNAVIGMEKAAVEARVRRLAAAVIATHQDLDRLEREWLSDPATRRALYDRSQDLVAMTTLLPRTHVLRLAGEHAARTVEEWAIQPLGTDDGRAGSLSMVIAMSLLRRALLDTDRAQRRAA